MSVQSRARNGTGSQPSQQMGAAELGSSSQRCQQMGAAELGSSSQRCVCAVPRQKWHWLTAISTDGSCRTRFELSEMCLCSPASEMTLAAISTEGSCRTRFSSQRCVCVVPRQKWHWHTAISTDGSCRSRFELSEVCLCSPASEMALAQPSQLPN